MKRSLITRIAPSLLIFIGILSACNDESYSDDSYTEPSEPGGPVYGEPVPPTPPSGSFEAVFSDIQENVFTPTCAVGCHSGVGAAAGLNLEATNSFAELVGVASGQAAQAVRVVAGDPDNSYLIHKLEGTAAIGTRMPPNGGVAQSTIDIVRQWVLDGAVDDRSASVSAVRVTSLSPAPGSVLTDSPTQIVAGFDRDLDMSTVNVFTFVLEASGGDTTFGDGNEVQIDLTSVAVPGTNMRSAVIDLGDVALSDDTYRVRLLGSGPSMIMDLDANALDGEFYGNFTSGDGSGGGNFAAEFSVTRSAADDAQQQ